MGSTTARCQNPPRARPPSAERRGAAEPAEPARNRVCPGASGDRALRPRQMIAALVLGAGSSRRMGRPKLLLELGGKPLIRRAVEQASAAGLEPVVVVVGPHRSEMEQALRGTAAQLVDNPDHLSGMASSLRAGLTALPVTVKAVVVLLGDQPFQGAE